ncbi:unnamed protein product [Symbiodinium sp. CCMP2592]|nr:unnamed protein product [Symbiodinium sp. CCMP2592]
MAQASEVSPGPSGNRSEEQQVMNRPSRSGAVLEGEQARPNYGAVNGVLPPTEHFPLEGSLRPVRVRGENGHIEATTSTAVAAENDGGAPGAASLPTGSAVEARISGPGATTSVVREQWQPPPPPPTQQQAAVLPQPPQHEATQLPRVPLRLPQPLQQNESTNRLPPPLHQAVEQLAEQRTAVVQAVQSRAQRALLVAPVLEHVQGPERGPQASPTWHSPTSAQATEPPLMSPETWRAMAEWTAQQTSLTTSVPEPPPMRDDSSAGSMSRELVMEEVKRQPSSSMMCFKQVEGNLNPDFAGLWVDLKALKLEAFRREKLKVQVGSRELHPVYPDLHPYLAAIHKIGDVEKSTTHWWDARSSGPEMTAETMGSLDGSRSRWSDVPKEKDGLSPLDVLVRGMKQLQDVYLEKKTPEFEALKNKCGVTTAPGPGKMESVGEKGDDDEHPRLRAVDGQAGTGGTAARTPPSSPGKGGTKQPAEPIQTFSPEALQNPELQTFMKEVNVMLQRMARLSALQVADVEAVESLRDEVALKSDTKAPPVSVKLADGKTVMLRQNRAGTLIFCGNSNNNQRSSNSSFTTIVPLGSLVKELACTVSWTKRGLQVEHPEHGTISTHVVESCPYIGEPQALELIRELESRKLEQLKVNTIETQLRMNGLEAQLSFGAQLQEYRRTGNRADGLKALMCEDSAFGVLTEQQRCSLIQDIDLSDKAGHQYLKALPIKRAMRRRLMTTRWLVHMYSGNKSDDDFKVLEEDGVTLLNIDLSVSKAFNVREPSPAYRALLWAAMRGQVHGVLGGPPRNEGVGDLVLKQMFLWAVARSAAENYEIATPGFAMTMPTASELWKSELWKKFRSETEVKVAAGSPSITVATSLELKMPVNDWEVQSSTGALVWTKEFKEILIRGFQKWRTVIALRRLDGPLSGMSKEELHRWIQHVRAGHVPYNKRCQTCVATRATGHAHRKVEYPSCYTMSVDVCGGHTPEALDNKYMLVASYVMPVLPGRAKGFEDDIINVPGAGVGDIPLGDPASTDPPDDLLGRSGLVARRPRR